MILIVRNIENGRKTDKIRFQGLTIGQLLFLEIGQKNFRKVVSFRTQQNSTVKNEKSCYI